MFPSQGQSKSGKLTDRRRLGKGPPSRPLPNCHESVQLHARDTYCTMIYQTRTWVLYIHHISLTFIVRLENSDAE